MPIVLALPGSSSTPGRVAKAGDVPRWCSRDANAPNLAHRVLARLGLHAPMHGATQPAIAEAYPILASLRLREALQPPGVLNSTALDV